MEIRSAKISSDLSGIVQVHIRSFPGFFMTNMGAAFLQEYYRTVLEFPENISLVTIQNNQVIGFVVGFGNPQAFYSFYRQRYRRLITTILLAVLRNPRLIRRVLSNFKRVSSVRGDTLEVELSSIGVHPSFKGVGHFLIVDFVDLARERGYQSVYLTTDSEGNEQVNLFYKKQGFILEQTFLSGGRKMNQYRLWL